MFNEEGSPTALAWGSSQSKNIEITNKTDLRKKLDEFQRRDQTRETFGE